MLRKEHVYSRNTQSLFDRVFSDRETRIVILRLWENQVAVLNQNMADAVAVST